jgi:diacylglycerol kinase family enzyme
MRRAALIYNPASGQDSPRRKAVIEGALSVLRRAGVEANALETNAPGSAGKLALEAVCNGCDTIIACGGDGTVHEIMQCLVGTQVALGVVPLGTANALAADLGLGTSPLRAVEILLTAEPVQVPVGQILFRDKSGAEDYRYFTVAAGVGADALCISMLDAGLKRRFGYALYMVQMLKVWATHSFPLFETVVAPSDGGAARTIEVSQILAVRIRDFGGLLHNLAPGASIRKPSLRLLAFKTRSRMDYLRFVMASLFRRQTFVRQIELLDVLSVECRARHLSAAEVLVEADGELLGGLPVRMEIASKQLTLLLPAGSQP